MKKEMLAILALGIVAAGAVATLGGVAIAGMAAVASVPGDGGGLKGLVVMWALSLLTGWLGLSIWGAELYFRYVRGENGQVLQRLAAATRSWWTGLSTRVAESLRRCDTPKNEKVEKHSMPSNDVPGRNRVLRE